jgi:O-antigen ligase/cytochrome c-type biogenesis protein CcmH/NrfG
MTPSGRAVVAAALPVGALVVDPGGLAPFGPAKWLVVPAIVLASAAAVSWRGRLRLARRPLVAWVLFLVVTAVAAGLGVDRLYAWTGTPERHLGAFTWLLCALAFAVGQLLVVGERRVVAAAAALAAGAGGVWAGAEALGWHPLHLVGVGDRPVGPFGSSAYLGAAAVLLAPAALGMALDRQWSAVARRAAAVAALAGAVGLVVSGARAAWLGGAVALLVVVARRGVGRRVAVAGGVATVAVVVVALAVGVGGRLPDLLRDREGGARGRLDEWRVAARVVATHPVLGVGPEGYRIAFAGAVDDAYERAHGRTPLPDRAHSALLDVAATTGLVGLLAYGALLLFVGRFLLRAVRASPPWLAGLAAGVLAYWVQSLFLFPIGELEPVVWLLAGIVVTATMRAHEAVDVHVPRLVPLAAGALAGATVVAGIADVAADRLARRTLATATSSGRDEPASAAGLRPDQIRYRLVAARVLERQGAAGLTSALLQIDRGLHVSPRDPVVRHERARLLLARARASGSATELAAARTALVHLAHDDPRNAEVLLRLGLVQQLTGHDAAAERAWLAAERLAPRSAAASTDLALAYARAGRWPEAKAAARRALARDPRNQRARSVLGQADGT